MNDIANFIASLSSTPPVFLYLSIILGVVLIVVGLRLKSKIKGKSTAGWICIGIGILSILLNSIQLFIRF